MAFLQNEPTLTQTGSKSCPNCQSRVEEWAHICPNCSYDWTLTKTVSPGGISGFFGVMGVLSIFFGFLILLIAIWGLWPTGHRNDPTGMGAVGIASIGVFGIPASLVLGLLFNGISFLTARDGSNSDLWPFINRAAGVQVILVVIIIFLLNAFK